MGEFPDSDEFDPARIADLASLGDEPAWLETLLHQFISDTRSRLEEIHAALQASDARKVAETAHALKGSSSNLGARSVAAQASRLQELGRSGNLNGGEEMLLALRRLAGKTITHLERTYLSGGGPA